jgi:hypothetical protein
MEFKFTKGKWHFDKEKAKVFKEDGNTLCVCYYSNIINKEECEPNALLISKSPELLTDLNDLVWLIEQGATIEELQERIKVSKKLIKEATQI